MVSWCSQKQHTIVDSSCYAEYIALHEASHKLTFLQQLLTGLEFGNAGPSALHCDNHTTSILSKDHVWHPQVKHICVKYHYVRELMTRGELKVKRIASKDNIANILTKPLAKTDFVQFCLSLGVHAPPLGTTSA
jgi:hypothetical protein